MTGGRSKPKSNPPPDQSEARIHLQPSRSTGLGVVRARGIQQDFASHAHSSLVLGWILDGTRHIETPGGRWSFSAGDAFCIPPWLPHCCRSGPTGQDYVVLSLSPELLRKILQEDLEREDLPCPRTVALPPSPELSRLEAIVRAAPLDIPLHPEGGLREALARFLAGCIADGLTESVSPPSAVARDACRYLLESLEDGVAVEELAFSAGLSEYYFSRLFRSETGMPPHAWHLQARAKAAVEMLLERMPIQQVALELGFSDQSHFTRVFRRAVGVPPGRLNDWD
ncbi:MAG TPA: AraC family transcriptional regulator [Fibrobacteria bacterium]|nr:AraC family transcriptional regulator [Fibrobacteria bacterium]